MTRHEQTCDAARTKMPLLLNSALVFHRGIFVGKSPRRIRNKSSPKRNLKQRKRRTSASDIPGFLLDLSYFMLHSDKQEVICGVTDSSCSLPTSLTFIDHKIDSVLDTASYSLLAEGLI